MEKFFCWFKNLSYLPKYHTYKNYNYVAKKLGGGTLASQIHEIDLITNFFGFPEKLLIRELILN